VSEHRAGDLHISVVCEKFNLNKFTLQHIFKEQEKETYRDYVERLRMERAFQLLEEGKWVKEVIPAVGYKNKCTFNNAFKKRFKHSARFFKK
jgi:two-component system response regulator YesN